MLYAEESFAPHNVYTMDIGGMFVLCALNAETFDKFHGCSTCVSFIKVINVIIWWVQAINPIHTFSAPIVHRGFAMDSKTALY